MPWFVLPACFAAGVFTANFVPHFVTGVQGKKFPTPFAKPPFRGSSSPRTNVLYGVANLAVAYVLLTRAATFDPSSLPQATAFIAGLTAMSLLITRSLARIEATQPEASIPKE